MQVGLDKLTVGFNGKGTHPDDYGSIQGNLPVPKSRVVYYFEALVKEAGEKGDITIGFTDEQFKMSKSPGCARPACLSDALQPGCITMHTSPQSVLSLIKHPSRVGSGRYRPASSQLQEQGR